MAWNSPRKPWNGRSKWNGFRRSPAKKISFKRLPRTVARKRTDWVSLYNDTGEIGPLDDGCTIRCIEFESNCNDASTRIAIMPQGAVEALYDDDVTIAAMRGFINMKPRWATPNGCDTNAWLARMQGEQWPIYMRAGLYKQELVDLEGGIPPFVNPLNAHDWTDVSALKKWNHVWQPRGRHGSVWQQSSKIVGVCSDTTQASYVVPSLVTGNGGGHTVPAVSTTCSVQSVGSGEGLCNIADLYFERETPAWYRMSLNRSRGIRLHENDSLDLFVNWSQPRPAECVPCDVVADGTSPCAIQFSIQLDVKLQFG